MRSSGLSWRWYIALVYGLNEINTWNIGQEKQGSRLIGWLGGIIILWPP